MAESTTQNGTFMKHDDVIDIDRSRTVTAGPQDRRGNDDPNLLWFCAWSPIIYILVFGLGWLVLAQQWPPVAPDRSAEEFADELLGRRGAIMGGGVALMVSTMLITPWMAYFAAAVRRVEGRSGVLTMMTIFATGTYMFMNFLTGLAWALAVFRPDRDPALVQFAADFSFFLFLGGTPTFLLIYVVMAYTTLVAQDRDRPVFPRWFGYVNALSFLLFLPEILLFFFKTGPFAWDGLFGFWIPAIVFIADMFAFALAAAQMVRAELAATSEALDPR